MSNKRLKLAISPCPNDTFIFGPWINELIQTDPQLCLDVDYFDIQELNERAKGNSYDLIKISAANVPYVIDEYQILACGGALTDRTGPLLIAAKPLNIMQLNSYSILIPGVNTTASFLLQFLFPEAKKLRYVLFSDIEEMIIKKEADAGVIIHESRFSFESKNLFKILDLGEEWFAKTNCPVPLGVIAIRRSLDAELKHKIQDQIIKSIEWAYTHFNELMPFIQSKSTELNPVTITQHIDLYVNQYSIDMGKPGKEAIIKLSNFIHANQNIANTIFM